MRSLLLLLFVAVVANAKVFERCEWARILKRNGMDGLRGVSLAEWVCLSYHESRYNTKAINTNQDGTIDYGIFQINSRWWCNNGQTPTSNGCNIRCNELLTDNVNVAITCAKRVVRDHNRAGAWVAWRDYCRDRDLSSYVAGCGV